MEENALGKKKSHRNRHSGRKSEKKKVKKDKQNPVVEELTDKQRNPKAFAFNSAIRAERRFRRKQDIDAKKQHVPLVDRTPLEPPPIVVIVVGPPKVGKSTLIYNLIKLFTRMPLTEIKGPVTIVTGKKRRITFIECNNDINSMIDLAKVADLVLLLCDASFGFEMEVFEFLNICQVHGMPRIMGVLTHLDMIKNSKTLKTTKKTLKHRFWTEVYSGAKLFYLSGIIHGEYLRNEIKNLGRFISVMKFRPLQWRTTHSYILGDRYEDLTNQELIRQNPKCDRNISLYGYVRGVPLKKESSVHIAGLGDYKIQDISYLPDPCPLPDQIKKRALIEKEKLIYAPFSGVGAIVYDKDAVYVELGGSHSHTKREENESENIVTNLIESKETLDEKMKHSELQIFTGGEKLTAGELNENIHKVKVVQLFENKKKKIEKDDLDEELSKLRKKQFEEIKDSGRIRRKVLFDNSNSNEFESENSDDEMEELEEEMDDQNETLGKRNQLPEYTKLHDNKDKEIHSKISRLLSELGNKKKKVNGNKHNENEGSDSDSSEEQNSAEKKFGLHKNINRSTYEENYIDSEEEEISKGSDDEIKSNAKKKIGSNQYKSTNKNVDSEDTSDSEDGNEKENSSEEESNDEDINVKWKDNLAKKAKESFLDRQASNKNLMKLVYGIFDMKSRKEEIVQSEDDSGDEIFKKLSKEQHKMKQDKDIMNIDETLLMLPWNDPIKDWLEPQNKSLILNCFVTGKWKESEDASELLKLDDAQDLSDVDSEIFGDFEDLETGEKHMAKEPGKEVQGIKRKREENEKDKEADKEALVEKKRKLKEKFDAEYDDTEKTSYYDDLKTSAEKQAQLNKTVFEDMPDDVRVQIEGYRPGMYIRIEFQNVPVEFVQHFDPTYPLVIGALNMGEENIGYVNVKLKKHRWYSKILKANDPLIISLGWRRFQTVPLYSKLEDDLKFRYLKYTPEHLSCNAHFWGPITPQGTGFVALQTLNNDQEEIKKLGFRIAATGAVQELDKSTKIMKKLKLIGYPLKIYKKTAFIKGMFNSALEVARFEGARIKTVSGIRGQIKKAVSKPEGCFRATFEDKILLSDIVFCRTWYKTDVTKFYTPITTLLLSPDGKNSWRGLRTAGEIKREKGIKALVNTDHLYTPIQREAKPFKPLVIPQKLQKALPYRDKPKRGVKISERKQQINRVAVIREPHEQKVSTMMKMLRASYENKQEKINKETKERLAKHRQEIETIEAKKDRKLKKHKKEVFRNRSKSQIRKENKGKIS